MHYLITSTYGQRIIAASDESEAEDVHYALFPDDDILDGLTEEATPEEAEEIGVSNS